MVAPSCKLTCFCHYSPADEFRWSFGGEIFYILGISWWKILKHARWHRDRACVLPLNCHDSVIHLPVGALVSAKFRQQEVWSIAANKVAQRQNTRWSVKLRWRVQRRIIKSSRHTSPTRVSPCISPYIWSTAKINIANHFSSPATSLPDGLCRSLYFLQQCGTCNDVEWQRVPTITSSVSMAAFQHVWPLV